MGCADILNLLVSICRPVRAFFLPSHPCDGCLHRANDLFWRWGRLAFVEEQRSKAVLLGLVAFVGMFGYGGLTYGKTLAIVNSSTGEFPQLPKATG